MRLQAIQLAYLIATALFIFSLHWMNDPKSARRGVFAGVAAMTVAIVGTLLSPGLVHWHWIAIAVALGVAVGVPLSWVPLTAVPQRTALSHAFGGLAAGLVGAAEYLPVGGRRTGNADTLPGVRDRRRNHSRLPHVHGQPHGSGQAAGSEVDPAAAGHLPVPEPDQLPAAGRCGRLRDRRDR